MRVTVDPCLAVIPARGGSKGLPGKNIRPLAGLPLLVHSLRCAQLVKRLSACVVSTDSEEIARIAREHGGQVPFMRPAELARDDSPTMPVLKHALTAMEATEGHCYASVLLLEPTSPGRLPEDIERAFETLEGDEALDGVVGCSQPSFNPFYVGVVERAGLVVPAFDISQKYVRRQDVPEFLRINGSLYLWRRDFVLNSPPTWLDGRHRALRLPEQRAFSIDDRLEFEQAELFIKAGFVKLPWL
jgi:CMP-N,N'-diacetyllegionaminic acid synthase